MRVLLVEDEQRLAENIVAALRESGLVVDHAADGECGSHLAEQGVYDAMVLDLMLPGKSGQKLLHDFRRKKFQTPVLILTAHRPTWQAYHVRRIRHEPQSDLCGFRIGTARPVSDISELGIASLPGCRHIAVPSSSPT
jgi:DNA-binding NarL/FixJ family response regulator